MSQVRALAAEQINLVQVTRFPLKFMQDLRNDFERTEQLQNLLVAHATGLGKQDDDEYQGLRKYFIANPAIINMVPRFLRTCRNLDQFWAFIKQKFPHYDQRRKYIWGEFEKLLSYYEQGTLSPADNDISSELKEFNAQEVNAVWQKALERRSSDPEGSITIAKTLLETVCKHILDELNVTYNTDGIEMPELYRLTSQAINLAPSQHTEENFKKILGGITSVVNELGSLRNRIGDAHGRGKKRTNPHARHAELAINLAGAMALFLIRTYRAKNASGKGEAN